MYIQKPVSFDDFEQKVYSNDINEAVSDLLIIFDSVEKGGLTFGANPDNTNIMTNFAKRFCEVFTALLLNPDLSLSKETCIELMTYKRHIVGFFEVAGFKNTDHIADRLLMNSKSESNQPDITNTDIQVIHKLLLIHSLSSNTPKRLDNLISFAPEVAFVCFVNLFDEHTIHTQQEMENKTHALTLAKQFKKLVINAKVLDRIANLWMSCSYWMQPNKHDIKEILNKALSSIMRPVAADISESVQENRQKSKPKIVIPIERHTSHSAMYRCYSPNIRQLKAHFEIIGVCRECRVDDKSKEDFDHVLIIDPLLYRPREMVAAILKYEPDILYFPSIGMEPWVILIANMRLAPIQVMTLGHPATSRTPYIDYAIVQHEIFSEEKNCFSEKVIVQKSTSSEPLISHPAYCGIKPKVNVNPTKIKICIPSISLKLNYEFMQTLIQIKKQVTTSVEFHFFPNETSLSFAIIEKRIKRFIHDAVVYQTSDYITYLNNINECDIQLSPFPFGGTNSNIDAIRQCIPLVCLLGDEPHSRTDALFVQKSKIPNWLIARSLEDYISVATKLIDDAKIRESISQLLLSQDTESIFFENKLNQHNSEFLNTMKWLYDNHNSIKDVDKSVWKMDEYQQNAQKTTVACKDSNSAGKTKTMSL